MIASHIHMYVQMHVVFKSNSNSGLQNLTEKYIATHLVMQLATPNASHAKSTMPYYPF